MSASGAKPISAAKVAAVLAGVVVVAMLVLFATSESGRQSSLNFEVLGQVAPPIQGSTLDGGRYDLAEHRGEWVVVNFFASTCVGCRVEHPELVEFAARHAEAGDASIVAVAFGDRESEARAFFSELGGDWPALTTPHEVNTIAVDYGVIAVPETLLVSPAGRVVQKWIGASGVTADGLDAAIVAAGGG